ncbi:hypothetical protein [Hymenobacter sp. BT491]|uniref:hypothetical protein n=1 Tax=Hymenobacter sp. BT491 TaxID=2766779 RepID=UPI0016537F01|nr:hypothetical protein [Hymenobacter sp. BT491]MBC6989629.1 hypothetical protein [Hymenobacter sp. BT491]
MKTSFEEFAVPYIQELSLQILGNEISIPNQIPSLIADKGTNAMLMQGFYFVPTWCFLFKSSHPEPKLRILSSSINKRLFRAPWYILAIEWLSKFGIKLWHSAANRGEDFYAVLGLLLLLTAKDQLLPIDLLVASIGAFLYSAGHR